MQERLYLDIMNMGKDLFEARLTLPHDVEKDIHIFARITLCTPVNEVPQNVIKTTILCVVAVRRKFIHYDQ